MGPIISPLLVGVLNALLNRQGRAGFEVSRKGLIHVVSTSSGPVPCYCIGDSSYIVARFRSKCFPHHPCPGCSCHCEVFYRQVHISKKLPTQCPGKFHCCSRNQDRHCQQRNNKLFPAHQRERQRVPPTSMVLESQRRYQATRYQATSCRDVSSFRPQAASSGNLRVLICSPDAALPAIKPYSAA